jgi:hypothetical protein
MMMVMLAAGAPNDLHEIRAYHERRIRVQAAGRLVE